jgi:hypothetical protein
VWANAIAGNSDRALFFGCNLEFIETRFDVLPHAIEIRHHA